MVTSAWKGLSEDQNSSYASQAGWDGDKWSGKEGDTSIVGGGALLCGRIEGGTAVGKYCSSGILPALLMLF